MSLFSKRFFPIGIAALFLLGLLLNLWSQQQQREPWIPPQSPINDSIVKQCEGYMTFDKHGGLGNRISHYATLLTFTKKYDMKPVLSAQSYRMLSEFFGNLSFPETSSTPCVYPDDFDVVLSSEAIKKGLDDLSATSNVLIKGWPHEQVLFNEHRDLLKREFALRPEYLGAADAFLGEVREKFLKSAQGMSKELSFVGVHVRRTDYKAWLKRRKEGLLLTKHYFIRAMKTMRSRLERDFDVVFVVASDDLEWCKKSFQGMPNVYFSNEADKKKELEPKGFDWALLYRCNHTILDYGTFGFWPAYLSDGQVIMAKNFSAIPTKLVLDTEKLALPNWQLMTDPCIQTVVNKNSGKARVQYKCS